MTVAPPATGAGTSSASGARRRYRMTLRDQSDLPEVPGNGTPPESPEDDGGDWPTDELADAPLRMPGENPDVETEL